MTTPKRFWVCCRYWKCCAMCCWMRCAATGLNGAPVATTKDLERMTRTPASMWEVTINRGGQQLTSVFGG